MDEAKIFLAVLLALLVGKGFALLPLSYATDDVSFATSPAYNNPGVLDQGRFGLYLLRGLNFEFGIYPTHANLVTGFLTLVAIAWSTVIVCRAWAVGGDVVTSTIVGTIYCLHPYTVEYFTFRVAVHSMFYDYFLGFLAFYLARWRWTSFAAATALVGLVAAKNQVILTFLVVASLFAALSRLVDAARGRENGVRSAIRKSRAVPRLAAIASGIVLYALLNASLKLMGIGALRGERLLPVRAWGQRLKMVGERIAMILWGDDPLVAPLAQLLVVAILVLAVLLIVWRISRSRSFALTEKAWVLPASVLLLSAAGAAVFTVAFVARDWYSASRVVASYGLFVAGAVAIASRATSGLLMRRTILALACLVAVSFAASNNRILTEQTQTNLRDFHQASRMIARLETSPGFDAATPVAVVGTARPPAPLGTAVGDLNQSAFSRPWSRLAILRAVSPYPLPAPSAGQRDAAGKYCAEAPAWPAPESVTVVHGLGIVCLGPGG